MRYLIIGASAAGLAAAETIRQWDPRGAVTVVSDEPHPPYSRPLLTYLLSGEVSLEKIWLKAADYFQEWGFEALLGEQVVQVAPEEREVRLRSGRACPYDRLLIASGARPRLPGIPGEDLEGVFTLRTLADWRRLDAALPEGAEVVVAGAGPVGLKAAEALARRGCRVALAELESQVLPRLVDTQAAAMLGNALLEWGIEVYCDTKPIGLAGYKGRVRALALADGRELPAQAVLFAIGVTPNTEFLADSGLAAAGGVPVDARLNTGLPEIYAAGDCVQGVNLLTGQPAYVPIWPAAVEQGKIAGANMAGANRRYPGLLPQNSISLRGFKIITGGLVQPEAEDVEIVSELDRRRGHYRRLAYREGRLVGLTLVGAVADAGIYFHLMSQQLPAAEPVTPGRLWG
ncbi:MAG: NAD(P)/FAD-dependent oxidoreductase [Deltaproteobacteria bacterium]|nr:MAG: NAD(P)/FAD-dependent oxidoreductase [Deltaproteobacteria bacterium]